jgi:predicted negative regulator of RcsB-dependent stress response
MKTKSKSKRKPKGVGNIAVRSKNTPAKKGKTIKLVSKKPNGTAILLTSLAIGITGALGYFGWQYYKKTQAGTTSVDKLNDELTKIKLPP